MGLTIGRDDSAVAPMVHNTYMIICRAHCSADGLCSVGRFLLLLLMIRDGGHLVLLPRACMHVSSLPAFRVSLSVAARYFSPEHSPIM